jgi:GNAT superfamily N-acetyltransferase
VTATQIVRLAAPTDVLEVATALSLGFCDDRWARWIFPHDETYAEYSTRYFTFWAERALVHGGDIWTTGDASGAFIALPFEALEALKHDDTFEERLSEAAGPYAERAMAFDRASNAHHPHSPVHQYGAFVGVAPAYRGAGLGAAMVRAVVAASDEQGVATYWEATSSRNSRLYSRVGLLEFGERFYLPGDELAPCAELIPVFRPARKRGSA